MITAINYNWYFSPENGEEFTNRTVGAKYGQNTVVKIDEHRAMGDGDKWYYDISYSDGTIERVFNPNAVFSII